MTMMFWEICRIRIVHGKVKKQFETSSKWSFSRIKFPLEHCGPMQTTVFAENSTYGVLSVWCTSRKANWKKDQMPSSRKLDGPVEKQTGTKIRCRQTDS